MSVGEVSFFPFLIIFLVLFIDTIVTVSITTDYKPEFDY